jgi:competence protein ComEC
LICKNIKISRALIFKSFLYCFLGAVFLELVFNFEIWASYLVLILGLILLLLNPKKKIILLLFFACLGIFIGWWLTANELARIYPREEKIFEGLAYLYQEPEIKTDYQKLVFCPVETQGKNILKPDCSEKFLIFGGLEKNYYLGEVLEINCRLKNPENKYSKFNYVNFLAKDRIYQICQYPEIDNFLTDEKKYEIELTSFYEIRNSIFHLILRIKKEFENKINGSFNFPESAYLAGLLLGGEDRLPEDVQENFRRTGTTHTIAVSGFNITVLASFFMFIGVLIGFYRQKAFWLAVFGIVFFVLMIGSPSSAVRAAIMGILILWASKNGRLADSVQAIFLAGALMITFSPLILIYDVGFQLSFLASLGIVLVYVPLSEKFNIKNDFLELKSIILVTISAQLGVMGILLYVFETFSPISLLANLIVLPLIPLIMLFGFTTVALAFVSPFVASFFALPTELALKLEILIIDKLAQISWASLEIGDIGLIGLVVYYFLFFLFVLLIRKFK